MHVLMPSPASGWLSVKRVHLSCGKLWVLARKKNKDLIEMVQTASLLGMQA